MSAAPADPGAVVERLRASKKYRHLADATLRRITTWAAARSRTARETEDRARRKLHQVFGAWLAGFDAAKALRHLEEASPDARVEAFQRVLAMHASTRERLPFLADFYRAIWSVTGPPASVLDLGCGLSPCALPWMGLPAGATYRASEIDRRLVDLGNRALALVGRPPLVTCEDLLSDPPSEPCGVVLLLKMPPSLEQQEDGVSLRLLRSLPARHVVVSFPSRSLGGRDRGMSAHYAALMERLLGDLNRSATSLEIGGERLHVIPGPLPPSH